MRTGKISVLVCIVVFFALQENVNLKLIRSINYLSSHKITLNKFNTSILKRMLNNYFHYILELTHGSPDPRIVDDVTNLVHKDISTPVIHLSSSIDGETFKLRFESLNTFGGMIYFSNESISSCYFEKLCAFEEKDFWNVRGMFMIVVTSNVPQKPRDVEIMLENFWEKCKVLYMAVVHVTTSEKGTEASDINITVSYFNPFLNSKRVKHISSTLLYDGELDVFSYKLINIHRSPIKVSIINKPPTCFEINDTKGDTRYEGPDGFTVETTLKQMNASPVMFHPVQNIFEWVYPYDNKDDTSKENFKHGTPDLDGNSKGLIFSKISAIVYPHDQICYTVIVPRAGMIPGYMNFILPFTNGVWRLYFLAFIFINVYLLLIKRFDSQATSTLDYHSSTLESLRLAVFSSSVFPANSISHKIYLFVCLWFGLVINNAYQGSLTSYMTIPKYYKDMDSFSDWASSYIRIGIPMLKAISSKALNFYTDPDLVSELKNPGERYLFLPTRNDIYVMSAIHKNISFLTDNIIGPFILNQPEFIKEGRPLLHMLSDCIINPPLVFRLPDNSPYAGRFNSLIVRIKEAGLIKKWKDDVTFTTLLESMRIKQESGLKVLSLEHLMLPFSICILGLFLSVLSFISELLFSKLF